MKANFKVISWIVVGWFGMAAYSSFAGAVNLTAGSGVDYSKESAEQVRANDLANVDRGDLKDLKEFNGPDANKRLMQKSSKELDELYAKLTSGPIPSGFLEGAAIIPPDRGIDIIKKLLHLEGKSQVGKVGLDILNQLPRNLWSGKFFQRETDPEGKPYPPEKDPRRVWLLNRINLTGESLENPQKINAKNMLFPAKVYCGQSLFDARRESIVIDYKYGEEDFPKWLTSIQDPATQAQRAALDWVAGPRGLAIRDEVRMVRPGLYLGRAYVHGAFLLHFALQVQDPNYNAGAQPVVQDECWIGHQRQLARNRATRKQSDYVNITDNGNPPIINAEGSAPIVDKP